MMQRRHCLRWGLGWATGLVSGRLLADARADGVADRTDTLIWRERLLVGFGTTLWLRAAHHHDDQLEQALTKAVNDIREIERLMSLFDPESALSRLNRQGALHQPDIRLLAVLQLAARVAVHSGGAFDISMQPLWQVWSEAAAAGVLPRHSDVLRAQRRVNWRAVEATTARVQLNQAGMQISLNGIAQGYAADQVRRTLQQFGVRHAWVDTGETGWLGQGPGAVPWALGIESTAPADYPAGPFVPQLAMTGLAMATSSDVHTTFSRDRRHHHIVNPKSGYSPPYWSSVSVIATSCALADALTKVFFMLPPSRILSEARRWGVEVVLQDKQGRWLSSIPGQAVTQSGLVNQV